MYLQLGAAQLMLEEAGPSSRVTGPLGAPLGRGMNLQIEVEGLASLGERLEAAGVVPFRPMRTEWYREGDLEHGQAELLVQDPDGYLLRFVEVLATRDAP